jgi:hypothetical protein
MSSLIHRHDDLDGSPAFTHGNLLSRSTHSAGHPIYVRGESNDIAEEHGKEAFGAGVGSVAVVFGSAYLAAPTVVATIDTGGAGVQSAGVQSVTTTGFTLNRSASGGTATGHWISMGQKA